ncbi:MAG: lipopolysaccharide transport system ATP-binding protein [Candidatus Methanophagaceae archaeon]|nr:MAG: lipopolysaccharide transport system ATP-binding protein [Methanophagales archaeon]KAF5435746.1 lipopolysaccharide transport system ATP-binding protein [Methanophagales archaeon]
MLVGKNVSKKFRIPIERRTTLFEEVVAFMKGSRRYEKLQALRNVSFEVKTGEIFGIIGPNGSGKTTLLGIIANIIYPDEGELIVEGRITPILALGVGFNPELTAKENVYLYGALVGMKKGEIKAKYEGIFKFAELRRFEAMKLKNFSSGMNARLAFSTAIATEPDILLVDEVLAVGDIAFQIKCMDEIKKLNENGTTIIFVSHNIEAVRSLCERAMFLNNGEVVEVGDVAEVVNTYLDFSSKR